MLTTKELKHICDLIGKKGNDGLEITEEEISEWDSVKETEEEVIFSTNLRTYAEEYAIEHGYDMIYRGDDLTYYVGEDYEVEYWAPGAIGIFVESTH